MALAPFAAREVQWAMARTEEASGKPNWGLFVAKVGDLRTNPNRAPPDLERASAEWVAGKDEPDPVEVDW